MVHMGKPSRGCEVCRKRRIKCDEALPSCTYCLKRKLTCPGYKSLFDVAWRDQNLVAENHVRRRKNATQKADRERIASKQLVKSIPRVLAQDYEDYALKFFFSAYILVPRDEEAQRGFLDCLYPVWLRTESTSPLRSAVVAVASCLLEAWSQLKSDLALSLSQPLYWRGIASLRKALQNPEGVEDDVVLASLLLEMYEKLRSFLKLEPIDSPHVGGTMALLQYKRRLPLASKVSQTILLGARNEVVFRALKNTEAVPSYVFKWADIAQDVPRLPSVRLDELNMEIANLQALAARLDFSTEGPYLSIPGILKKALELEQNLLAWKASLSPLWTIVRVSGSKCIPTSVRTAGLYHDYCDIYRSIFIADILNSYRCSRIKVQLIVLACTKHLHTGKYHPEYLTALECIQELADGICASIPYHLGDRVTSCRIDDKSAQYPHIEGLPIPMEHRNGAAAFAGWFLATRLGVFLSPEVPLKATQRQWIGVQMHRIMMVYAVNSR